MEAAVGAVGARPPCTIVVEALKAPMLTASETKKKESLPAPMLLPTKKKIARPLLKLG
jgi:hypothetical protein